MYPYLIHIVCLKIKGQIECNMIRSSPHRQLGPLTQLKDFPLIKRKYPRLGDFGVNLRINGFKKKSFEEMIFSGLKCFVNIEVGLETY